jgi:transcription termination factor Rho
MDIKNLIDLALQYKVENAAEYIEQDVVFALLTAHAKANGEIYTEGVLETLQDGFGFLRSPGTTIFLDQMIFTSVQVKFVNTRCEQAIQLPEKFVRRVLVKDISLFFLQTNITDKIQKKFAIKFSLKTSLRFIQLSV